MQRNRNENGFQIMKMIGPFADDMQSQIDLTGRVNYQGSELDDERKIISSFSGC